MKANLFKRVQLALWNSDGETYVDTGVKMLLAIVIGALLLTGIYGIFKDVVLENVSSTIQEFFDRTPTLNGGGSGGNGGSGGQQPEETVTMYSYNGTELADINSVWTDKDAYPYACIFAGDDGVIYLWVASCDFVMDKADNMLYYNHASEDIEKRWVYNSNSWTEDSVGYVDCIKISSIVWANADVTNWDYDVFFPESDAPVPVS